MTKRKVVALIMMCVGVCLLLYPIVGNIINVTKQNTVQSLYEQTVENMTEEEKEEVKSSAEEYNEKLAEGEISVIDTDEDSLSEDYDDGSGYTSLDIGAQGVIGTIKIPKIGVELPIYQGTAAATLEKGVGHLRTSSLPVGGANTHCVLTGHTGLPSSMLFTDLDKLEVGDMFYIKVLDDILAYQVCEVQVVDPTDTSALAIQQGRDLVTLLTCYPYGINSHRLLVTGERVAYTGGITFGETESEYLYSSDSVTSETSDTASSLDSDLLSAIEEDLSNNTRYISIYGFYVPMLAAVLIIIAVVAVAAVAIVLYVRRTKKRKADIS